MAAHPRKLSEEQRRALQLLASIPFGASETIMFAHGFKRKTLAACRTQVSVFVRADNSITRGDDWRIHGGCR